MKVLYDVNANFVHTQNCHTLSPVDTTTNKNRTDADQKYTQTTRALCCRKRLARAGLAFGTAIVGRALTNTGDHHPNGVGVVDRELQCQHEGGTCEFFLICWMSRGLLQGTCDGLLRGCCHRTAKSANLATVGGGATANGDSNSLIDLTHLPNTDYGPVTNEPSECN